MPTDGKDEGEFCAAPPLNDETHSTSVVLVVEKFASPGSFQPTRWTVVMAAAQGDSAGAALALEQLCTTYWWPLYAFVRRWGRQHHDAQDLVQGFLCQLIARNSLASVDKTKGKFRSFLLAAMKNFLAKDWNKRNTLKGGGGYTKIPIDAESAEEQYLQIPAATQTPEQIYDYQWAIKLFAQVLNRLREEEVAKGRKRQFDALKIFLTGERSAGLYAELATKLETTEAALKMAVCRLKKRYGQLLREEIARTVSRPEEVEDELQALAAILSA